jgi:glycosyltransferase involved in cell wall biosynthesis
MAQNQATSAHKLNPDPSQPVESGIGLSKAGMEMRPSLLVVGPLPPPPSGATVSFQIFCEEVSQYAGRQRIEIIDSSPKRVKKQTDIISSTNVTTAWRVFWQFCRRVRTVELVLIFGSNGFLLSMFPLLLAVARIARKPCYVRAFGGSLDRFCEGLAPPFRSLLLLSLREADGLIVQTELLHKYFTALIGRRVHLVPGYRYMASGENGRSRPLAKPDDRLKLVFLGHIREAKGVFVLLESLRSLDAMEREKIHCDIFGPVYDSVANRFRNELAKTGNATYGGVLEPDAVVPILRNYDALVFPTYYPGEGHPGVLIEAMMAGIPAIATAFRSIPELIEDRVNGLLVIPQDTESLTRAIRTIYSDRPLLAEMSKRNWERRGCYDARDVVPLIMGAIGV